MIGDRGFGLLVIVLFVGVSDMSGWMFMGFFGVVYLIGIFNFWFGIGLILGVYLNYFLLVLRFRVYIEVVNDFLIVFDYLENCFRDKFNMFRFVLGIIIFVFFIFYVLLGIVVGGKLFVDIFGLIYIMGVVVILFVVVFYIYFGGFLVVSFIDFF